jgi:hypothetical protein
MWMSDLTEANMEGNAENLVSRKWRRAIISWDIRGRSSSLAPKALFVFAMLSGHEPNHDMEIWLN